MRKTLLVGLVLTVAAVLAVFVGSWLDLEIESVALLGVTLGAVVALVPDRTPLMRLAGFVGGFIAAWVGYFLRAGMLPDTTTGRAVTAGIVVALAVAIAAATMGRVPLWSTLLGAGAFVGAYEYAYSVAPPEIATTSVSTATALLFTAAIGFLAAALMTPAAEAPPRERARRVRTRDDDDATARFDDMMEKTK